jgi:hypothetical protein
MPIDPQTVLRRSAFRTGDEDFLAMPLPPGLDYQNPFDLCRMAALCRDVETTAAIAANMIERSEASTYTVVVECINKPMGVYVYRGVSCHLHVPCSPG